MASRATYAVKSIAREIVEVFGSFAPAGTGAPTGLEAQGVASVERTGAGAFLITLQDEYAALVSAGGTVQLSAAADMAVQFGDYDADAKTLVLRTVAGATETDIAADANNKVHFRLAFRNSSIK